MSKFCVGFSRVRITPMLGIDLAGYYEERHAERVLDDLEINAVAFSCEGKRMVLLSCDVCNLPELEVLDQYRKYVADQNGLEEDSVWISATHTHTGPIWKAGFKSKHVQDFVHMMYYRLSDAVRMALEDLKPARMGWAVGQAPHIAFVRRYRMKDGSIRTNPGMNNPDIVAPIGDVDERVNVLRFERENAEDVVLVNFGEHPDVVGGNNISADWPGFLRRGVEKALDNVHCVFFNGAEGDVNHVNVHPVGGDFNDLANDFDDVLRGYGHSRHMGRVLTGAVLQVYDKVNWTEVDSIQIARKVVNAPSNMPNPEDIPEARRIYDLHYSGRDDELPYKAMQLTTFVAEAERMLRLQNGPESFALPITAAKIGEVAIVGLPGEPFTGIGRGIKDTAGWKLILPVCIANGAQGYFPMKEAYEEGGYEARSSNFKEGVAELLIDGGKSLLAEIQ